MQPFPFPSPFGPPPPVAGLIDQPDPSIGRVVLGYSTIDVDGFSLKEGRTERVGEWWSPMRSWSRAGIALFPIGATAALAVLLVVGSTASALDVPQALMGPLVTCAAVLGLGLGWLGGMRLLFSLEHKRTGENFLVGESGAEIMTMTRGVWSKTSITYAEDVAWAESVTRYVGAGSGVHIGTMHTLAWVAPNGEILHETRVHARGTTAETKTHELASRRRAEVRLPMLAAALQRGDAMTFPILAPGLNTLYDRSTIRPRSAARFEKGRFTLELDGRTAMDVPTSDLRVVIADGQCTFRSRSSSASAVLGTGELPDALLLGALFT